MFYTVRHKKHTQNFLSYFEKSGPILMSFATNIPDTTGHQMTLVSHLTHCLFLHYLEKRKTNKTLHFSPLVLLVNQNNTQNTHFVHIFVILADSLSD